MTYDQFKAELGSIGLTVPEPKPKGTKKKSLSWQERCIPDGIPLIDPKGYSVYSNSDPSTFVPALVNKWRSGGTSGGSCWNSGSDEDPHYSVPGDPEPAWDELDQILEHFCPDIPYLKYKKILPLTTTSETSETEYYGNSTSYTLRILKLKDLYNFLFENDLLNPPKPDAEQT